MIIMWRLTKFYDKRTEELIDALYDILYRDCNTYNGYATSDGIEEYT